MQLAHEFIKLPYRFDVETLRQEVLGFAESQWCPHPDGFQGNSSLPLVNTELGPATKQADTKFDGKSKAHHSEY